MKNKVFSQWHRRLLNVNSEYIQLLCKNLLLHHHVREVMITNDNDDDDDNEDGDDDDDDHDGNSVHFNGG